MRGGKRPGAGRKKGSVTKATVYRQEMLARAAADGISPLEVMMSAMREAWDAGDKDKAVQVAEKAAPYIHAKLAAVQHSGDADNPVHTRSVIEQVIVDAARDLENHQGSRSTEARATH